MFSEALRTIRKRNNITQGALAKEIGVTQQTIGKWETGLASPSVSMITRVAEFFNVSLSYFIDKPIASEMNKEKCLAHKEFESNLSSFQALATLLSNENEEQAYKALNGVLEILPLCFLENNGDGKFVFDQESFLLYMKTIEQVSLFSFWIETKGKEFYAAKTAKEAFNFLSSAISLSGKRKLPAFNPEYNSEYSNEERSQEYKFVCEQIQLLFDELKESWSNNTYRLLVEYLQDNSKGG